MLRYADTAERVRNVFKKHSLQPDELNGQWVTWQEAVCILELKKATLDKYRSTGLRAGDKRSGSFNHAQYKICWRASGTRTNAAVEYLIPNTHPRFHAIDPSSQSQVMPSPKNSGSRNKET